MVPALWHVQMCTHQWSAKSLTVTNLTRWLGCRGSPKSLWIIFVSPRTMHVRFSPNQSGGETNISIFQKQHILPNSAEPVLLSLTENERKSWNAQNVSGLFKMRQQYSAGNKRDTSVLRKSDIHLNEKTFNVFFVQPYPIPFLLRPVLLSSLHHISMSRITSNYYAPFISQAYHPKLSAAESSIDFHWCIRAHCHLGTFVNTAVSMNIQLSTHPECAHAFSSSSSAAFSASSSSSTSAYPSHPPIYMGLCHSLSLSLSPWTELKITQADVESKGNCERGGRLAERRMCNSETGDTI